MNIETPRLRHPGEFVEWFVCKGLGIADDCSNIFYHDTVTSSSKKQASASTLAGSRPRDEQPNQRTRMLSVSGTRHVVVSVNECDVVA